MSMQSGSFKIVTDRVVRNPSLERKLIEYNREMYLYYMIIVGCVMVLFAVVW